MGRLVVLEGDLRRLKEAGRGEVAKLEGRLDHHWEVIRGVEVRLEAVVKLEADRDLQSKCLGEFRERLRELEAAGAPQETQAATIDKRLSELESQALTFDELWGRLRAEQVLERLEGLEKQYEDMAGRYGGRLDMFVEVLRQAEKRADDHGKKINRSKAVLDEAVRETLALKKRVRALEDREKARGGGAADTQVVEPSGECWVRWRLATETATRPDRIRYRDEDGLLWEIRKPGV